MSTSETFLVHVESDSDSDEDEVQRILDGTSVSPKRKNKRLSVWSTKNASEVIAISSNSDTEDASDDDSVSIQSQQTPASRAQTSSTITTKQKVERRSPLLSKPSILRNGTTAAKSRPPSKKRMQELLATYAQELYTSLNDGVFGGKLPPVQTPSCEGQNTCEIIWSNTLKKTAGRAVISRCDKQKSHRCHR